MNILQRRMFQDGGPSDRLVQTKPVNSELIRYYVQQGYSPLEIQEVYPVASLGLIEQIAKEEGGSVNPAVSLGESFTGSPVVTPNQRADLFAETMVTPSGNLSFEQSASPELPRLEDISVVPQEVKNYIVQAGSVLDKGALNIGLQRNFGMSEPEANIAIDQVTGSASPEMDMRVDTPELTSLSDITSEEQIQSVSSTLRPNEYRASDGKVYEIDPNKFLDQLKTEDSRIIGGLLMNPNVEYGSNLASIVEGAATRRSSTLVPEENIRVGQGIQGLNAAEILQSGAKLGVDTAKEGIESLYNIARAPFTNPTIAGIFGSRERARGLRESGAGDRVNLFETGLDDVNLNNPFRAAQTLVTGGFDEYFKTGGEKPATLDSIVRESSIRQVQEPVTDRIADSLNELEQQAVKKVEEKKEAAGDQSEITQEEVNAEAETISESQDTTGDVQEGVIEEEKDLTPPVVSSASSPAQVGSVFNNQNFIRYVANLSKGLAQAKDLGSGLALGSAMAAEERGLRDLEEERTKREVLLKTIESGGSAVLKPTDAAKISEENKDLTANIKLFQKSQSNIKNVDEVINIVKAGGATGFNGLKNKLITQAMTFIKGGPKNWENIDPRSRADAILLVLQQENIREILGESGRTISNLDREIIKDVFGNITVFTSEAEIIKKLNDSRTKTLKSANETKGNINANLDFFDLIGRGSVVAQQNSDLLKRIKSFDAESYSPETGYTGDVVDMDMRSEFNQ